MALNRIPPPRQALVDNKGVMAPPWYRFLAPLAQSANILEAGSGLVFNGNVLSIDTNGVSSAQLRQGAATSVIGRAGNTTGNVADIVAVGDRRVLGRQGGQLGFFDSAQVRSIDTQMMRVGWRSVTSNDAYTNTDYLIVADATAGNITLTLPTLAQGRMIIAKKIDASANSVTLSGGANIDGAGSKATTTQYASFTLIGGATEWHIC
jgi:hypothetical protein